MFKAKKVENVVSSDEFEQSFTLFKQNVSEIFPMLDSVGITENVEDLKNASDEFIKAMERYYSLVPKDQPQLFSEEKKKLDAFNYLFETSKEMVGRSLEKENNLLSSERSDFEKNLDHSLNAMHLSGIAGNIVIFNYAFKDMTLDLKIKSDRLEVQKKLHSKNANPFMVATEAFEKSKIAVADFLEENGFGDEAERINNAAKDLVQKMISTSNTNNKNNSATSLLNLRENLIYSLNVGENSLQSIINCDDANKTELIKKKVGNIISAIEECQPNKEIIYKNRQGGSYILG